MVKDIKPKYSKYCKAVDCKYKHDNDCKFAECTHNRKLRKYFERTSIVHRLDIGEV
jgi:hypothetical protein